MRIIHRVFADRVGRRQRRSNHRTDLGPGPGQAMQQRQAIWPISRHHRWMPWRPCRYAAGATCKRKAENERVLISSVGELVPSAGLGDWTTHPSWLRVNLSSSGASAGRMRGLRELHLLSARGQEPCSPRMPRLRATGHDGLDSGDEAAGLSREATGSHACSAEMMSTPPPPNFLQHESKNDRFTSVRPS